MLGLDSTVNKQNFGSVGEHLEWLERQLSDTHGLPALLFLHHPVIASGIPTLDESMCRGLDKLESILRRNRARILAIAAGHVHRPAAGMFAGFRLIFVAQFARRTRCGSAASRFLR